MTRRELVKAAIQHQATPRIPYIIDIAAEGIDKIRPPGTDPALDLVDNDAVGLTAPWWGWHELGEEWFRPALPTWPPTVVGMGSYEEFREGLKRLRDETDKYILIRLYGSHFEKANFARGIENFLADMAGEPAFARKLLNTIIDKNMVMLDNIVALPEIDGILLGSDWGSQRELLMSPRVWDDMIAPGEQREYELVHAYGKDVWLHSCGYVVPLIPRLIEIGLDVLNPVQPECMDIAALKRDFGDKLTFWGGISTQQTLPFGTPEEVKQEARSVRDMMSRGGGYIFSPAQEVLKDVPGDNIKALLEVAREGRD